MKYNPDQKEISHFNELSYRHLFDFKGVNTIITTQNIEHSVKNF